MEITAKSCACPDVTDSALNRFCRANFDAPCRTPDTVCRCLIANELHLSLDCRERGIMSDAGALEALVTKHMVTAMKAHDAERTGTLRLIKTALKNKSIDKRAPLTPAEEQQALATMIKQRRDSIELFTKGNRAELTAKEAMDTED